MEFEREALGGTWRKKGYSSRVRMVVTRPDAELVLRACLRGSVDAAVVWLLSDHTALECVQLDVTKAQPAIRRTSSVGVSPKDEETVGTAQATCGLSARTVSG